MSDTLTQIPNVTRLCRTCGQPDGDGALYSCAHCQAWFCLQCCDESEGYGFCFKCFPYGAPVQWDDSKGHFGEERKGACLHRRGCRMLQFCVGDDYAWVFVAREAGEKMLKSGYLKPCKVCGTGLDTPDET